MRLRWSRSSLSDMKCIQRQLYSRNWFNQRKMGFPCAGLGAVPVDIGALHRNPSSNHERSRAPATDVALFHADGQDAFGMAIEDKARFKALLDGYNGRQVASSPDLVQVACCLLKGFQAKHEAGRKLQEFTADDFNLLDTLQVAGEEIRHSMMLAWLLDREATHAQGNLGFRLFLKHVDLNREYSETNYQVLRERSGAESRIDVEVAARGEFIIHIENKIYSCEGDNQTKREWEDLQTRADGLSVPRGNRHGLYLTLDRRTPASPNAV